MRIVKRRILPHLLRSTGGLFLGLSDDDWLPKVRAGGVPCEPHRDAILRKLATFALPNGLIQNLFW